MCEIEMCCHLWAKKTQLRCSEYLGGPAVVYFCWILSFLCYFLKISSTFSGTFWRYVTLKSVSAFESKKASSGAASGLAVVHFCWIQSCSCYFYKISSAFSRTFWGFLLLEAFKISTTFVEICQNLSLLVAGYLCL